MSPLSLFNSFKQRGVSLFLFFTLFSFFLLIEFHNYQKIISSEVYKTDAVIQNIYYKEKYNILKLQTDNFTFFTSIPKDISYTKLQKIQIFFLTTKITFLDYLKGFYTHSFHIQNYEEESSIKNTLYDFIDSQHQNKTISSLYTALFLAIPIDQEIRDLTAEYGISHLIAISGFHLGIMSLTLYFLLHLFYNPIHQKYFPYRNKRFDILIVSTLILFSYLVLVDFVPSLLRAFTMLLFGLIMLRSNIKILSFETLFWIVIVILALFPKLLFSLSLWFSVAGVFYIFLFLRYFKDLNKYFQIIFFNLWIYLAMNPIVHYFFSITSYEQLISPLLTLLFTLFYPLTFILHIIGLGDLFDPYLESVLAFQIDSFDKPTLVSIFILYLGLSLFSIYSKKAFYALNTGIVGFTLYLFI